MIEFEKLKKKEGGNIPKKLHKWKPPPPGYYKINIDASYQAKKKDHVDRDSLQEITMGFMEGGCGHLEHVTSLAKGG